MLTVLFFTGTASAVCCDADLDDDGDVDFWDYIILSPCMVPGNPQTPECDVNCDGRVNMLDAAIVECFLAPNGGPQCCENCGSCCLEGQYCAPSFETECLQAGGAYQGDNTVCPEANAGLISEPGGSVFIHYIGPPSECPVTRSGAPPTRDCPPGGVTLDVWVSDPDNTSCHNFGVAGSPAIPADFFGPGSEPFTGQVCLSGVPSGHPEFPDADTVIRRIGSDIDRCTLTGAPTYQVEIVALSLVSVAPITVIVNGQPENWNVAVDLSAVPAPLGNVNATRTHCNGGIYSSNLNVQPRFTFTKVGNPGEVRVLDTGLEGIPYVALTPGSDHQWAIDIPPGIEGANYCTTFHPGYANETVSDCDCNTNDIRDVCDIENGTSQDVNGNGFPDECEGPVAVEPTGPARMEFMLGPAIPNPTMSSTTLMFNLNRDQHVTVTIHDVRGRVVKTVVDEVKIHGGHLVKWDGRDETGNEVAPSIYYAKLVAEEGVRTTRIVIVK
jgi:hypothetical protein